MKEVVGEIEYLKRFGFMKCPKCNSNIVYSQTRSLRGSLYNVYRCYSCERLAGREKIDANSNSNNSNLSNVY